MSHIQSHHGGTEESHETFLVIFKVRGQDIQLWNKDKVQAFGGSYSFRISRQNVDSSERSGGDIKVFVLSESGSLMGDCDFQAQQMHGLGIAPQDLAIFMSSPISSSQKASYMIDLNACRLNKTSLEDLSGDELYEKIGSAYLYLDPGFSSQGIQRTPIIATNNHAPIGQMQVEYMIVTNPVAYGQPSPRPEWLYRAAQLDAGHRGSGSGCRMDLPDGMPENTIASFNYAHRHGADMCELDVMCTSDGVPVIYHNYTLDTSQVGSKQIDQLTMAELRAMSNYSIHDKDCHHHSHHNGTSNTTLPLDFHTFPTLEEVLKSVDKTCALNIELKWPQMLPNGKSEATHYREINDNVDRILHCIYKHSDGRAIFLSTFNADVAIMLRLKQTTYPVLFLTTGDSARFNDPATKTIKNAIHFAQAFNMAGINPNVAKLNEYLVRYAQDRGLLVYAWGDIKSAQAVRELKRYGLNGVIYDKIDLIKPRD